MNARWFYFLFANVAVLAVNIWLFVDKTDPMPSSVETAPALATIEVLNDKLKHPRNNNAKNKGISSIDSFYFMLNDPLAPRGQTVDLEQDLKPELITAQALISEKNTVIKNVQAKNSQQSKKIASLEKQNNKLSRQLFRLGAELDRSEEKLVANKQTIELLTIEQQKAKSTPLKTQNQLVKKSIDSKQDLVVLKANKNKPLDSVVVKKEMLNEELEDDNFSGSVEFGFKYEQDNQITRAVSGRLVLDYDEPDKYNLNSDLEFEFESEDDVTSTDKYRWQLQSDYNLNPNNTAFARSDISRSKFSSYQQEDIFTVGYGRIFFNTDAHKFNVELGPGYRSAVPNYGEDAVSIDEFIVRTRLNYERIVTESLQVKVDAVLEAGHSNSVYNVNFKAQNRIYQELHLIFDFGYKYTENVPVDTVNKEIASGLGLLYAF